MPQALCWSFQTRDCNADASSIVWRTICACVVQTWLYLNWSRGARRTFFKKINVPARLMDAYIKTSVEFNIYNLFLWGGGSFVGLCDPHPPSAVSLPYRFFAWVHHIFYLRYRGLVLLTADWLKIVQWFDDLVMDHCVCLFFNCLLIPKVWSLCESGLIFQQVSRVLSSTETKRKLIFE